MEFDLRNISVKNIEKVKKRKAYPVFRLKALFFAFTFAQ